MCCVPRREEEGMVGNEIRKIIGHRRASASILITMGITWSFEGGRTGSDLHRGKIAVASVGKLGSRRVEWRPACE